MSVANRLLTYDDLLQMPNDGNRYEIVDGELIVSASPTLPHQTVSRRLTRRFEDHVEPRGLGFVYSAPADVELAPNRIVVPDVVFVSTARQAILTETRIVGVPDLIVEVLSPSTRTYDEVRKAQLYAEAGIPEYWLADLNARALPVFVLVDGVYRPVPEARPGVAASVVLPGFEVEVVPVFANLLPGRA